MDIKNTKEVLDLGIGLGNALGAAAVDGKIDLADLGQLMVLLPLVGPALGDINQVPAELKDLSAEEVAELKAHIEDKFDIPQEKIEKAVEAGLEAVVAIHKLIAALKA